MKFLRWLAPLFVLGAAGLYCDSLRLRILVWSGRANGCTMERALEIPAHEANLTAAKDRILAATKKLQSDEHYDFWDTPRGKFWLPKGSQDSFMLPFNLAEQDQKIYGTGNRDIQPGDVVLDCGANIGVFTRSALDRGAKLVVAIEPAPENIECLRRNFAKEIAEKRVIVYPKGVWDKDDMLTLRIDPHNSAADSFVIHRDSAADGEKVPLTTIDKLVSELGLEKVSFIKMDIEGAELKALAGGKATIKRFHPRMSLSAYHHPDHAAEVPKAVRATGADYKMECGPCAEVKQSFILRPDILYFY